MVYVAKITESRGAPKERAIEDAINHAVTEWNVDIINVSSGFYEPREQIRQAIQCAHASDIMFASGHNDGTNKPLAFPASAGNVIAVGATNNLGKQSSFSPLSENKAYFFTAFVERIFPLDKETSGTSFAAPIAAGSRI
ncbi:subtilisin-like protein [Lentithecium fluviatile CBS 122367]|uniref:Subtilisin-like protein n=1 Tax=Lentithecium fluviatile CBS 122367 TaxID=1168545 RepID=A0A6G1IIZ1_9PLEO|nr:subtilisin-like protein [Lentithecium fluviatile CBS 122367]